MKTRRWMQTLLEEACKPESQKLLAWTRRQRRKRMPEKPAKVSAAE